MSCSELKAPETLIETDSLPVWMTPAGLTMFCLQRRNQCASIDAQTGEHLHREIDEDLLVLRSEDLDLGDVRDAEEL